MFKNYIKIAWRNLLKNKAYTFLNMVGLSIAFGVAILLSMTAFFELSYDKFHKDIDNTYQVYYTEQSPKGTQASISQPIPFAEALKKEVPGVERITRYLSGRGVVTYKEKELNMSLAWVDQDFFSIFSFPVIQGVTGQSLIEGPTVVITNRIANRIFGTTDAVGKTVMVLFKGKEQPMEVSAVLKDITPNSSISFDMAINIVNMPKYQGYIDEWKSKNHDVYLQLQNEVSVSEFEKRTFSFTNLHYKNQIESAKRDGASPTEDGQYCTLNLLPFKDRHFVNYNQGEAKVTRTLPYIILGIAFLIVFIACINFINMSIAKNSGRLQEIGMRKTMGAAKRHVFYQFWGESIFIFLFTILIGIVLSVLFLDDFKILFRTRATLDNVFSPTLLTGAILAFFLITFIAGGYPAILLSKLGTLQALKGKLNVKGGNGVRNFLMVIQFSIAILLISGTLVLRGQLEYMRTKDLGYNKEHVISVPLNGKKDSYAAVQLLREELKDHPNIISVTASNNTLGLGKDGNAYSSVMGFDYKNRGMKTNMLVVDYDYPETLDIELASGRSFSRDFATDSLSILINESMARQLGEEDPLHKQINSDGRDYTIVGVLKDYHFTKLDKEIAPITLFMDKDWRLYYAYIKIAPTNITRSFDVIQQAWQKIEPNARFLGSFLDENIDRTLRREKKMMAIITSGAIIAIVLSCIGLLAISLLVVSQRTKEIGIRKVVGASTTSLTYLLAKDFMKLVVFAFIIIVPIAWLAASNWLANYTYRIDLSVWFFITAGLMTSLIALATISTGTIKAALQNPVKSLRTE